MRKKMRQPAKALLLLLMIVLFMLPFGQSLASGAPYNTFSVDGRGRLRRTQTAYSPHETIVKFGDESLSEPSDLFMDDEGLLYVADTGNSRIVVGNAQGKAVRVIGEGTLMSPMGLFVTKDKEVFVADRDAGAVFVFSREGELLRRYERPASPLYGQGLAFMPLKIAVNDAGIMFIVSEANTNGIIQLSPAEGGTFLGYFGTNLASADFMTIFYRAILTDKQRARMVSNIPSTPDNLDIDAKGLIYSVTRGEGADTLKRLNIAGKNMLNGVSISDEVPQAVAVGNHENIYVLSRQGYLYEYNFEGDLLFLFGGLDDGSQRVGLSTITSALQVDANDRIYVLDRDKAQIQIFKPTEFTMKLHKALDLYAKGRYTAAKEPLEDVLSVNSMFTYANKAMGRAYFQEEDYDSALYYARIAQDRQGYSDAYWEVRNLWLRNHLIEAVLVLAALALVLHLLKRLDRRYAFLAPLRSRKLALQQHPSVQKYSYPKFFSRHPFEGSYGLAREGRASYRVSFLIIGLFALFYVIDRYTRGFLSKTVPDGYYNVAFDFFSIPLFFAAAAVCHYLVCSINEGEASFKKLFSYMAYSLLPYLFLTPLSYLLSFVLTNNEEFLYSLINIVIYVWIVLLFVIAVKEVNNYSVKETVKVILLTLFTLFILIILAFIIYVLWAQVFEFIREIFGEAIYRNEM